MSDYLGLSARLKFRLYLNELLPWSRRKLRFTASLSALWLYTHQISYLNLVSERSNYGFRPNLRTTLSMIAKIMVSGKHKRLVKGQKLYFFAFLAVILALVVRALLLCMAVLLRVAFARVDVDAVRVAGVKSAYLRSENQVANEPAKMISMRLTKP